MNDLKFLHPHGAGLASFGQLLCRLSLNPLLLTCSLRLSCPAQEWSHLPPLPDPHGVAAPFAGVSNGALIVAGGANFPDKTPWEGGTKVWHDRVWVLEKPDGTWREAGKLDVPLAYGACVSVRDRVLCLGGSDPGRHYARNFELYWSNGELAQRDLRLTLPIPLANAAAAVCRNEVVYVACGSTEPGEKSASIRVFSAGYNPKGMLWREIPPLPAEPRILPVAAAQGDTFYLFGGAALEAKDGNTVRRYLRDAWSYRKRDGWKRLADIPKPLAAAPSPAPVVNGRILVLAGDDGSRIGIDPASHPGFPSTIYAYNIAANTWSEAGETPAPRVTVPCVEWRGNFVIPSGEVRPGVRSQEVWRFKAAKTNK